MQIKVKVYPNSKEVRIEKGVLAELYVHVFQPALERKANRGAQHALAEYYSVKPYKIRLVRGQK